MLLFDDFHVLYLIVDINECGSNDLNNCHENAQCINTEGSFTCSCNPGYTGDGVACTSKLLMQKNIFGMNKIFRLIHSIYTMYMYTYLLACMCSADINECEQEIHSCSPYANCTDTDGSFNCTCREGFEGDGFNCTGMYLHKHSCVLKMMTSFCRHSGV